MDKKFREAEEKREELRDENTTAKDRREAIQEIEDQERKKIQEEDKKRGF